MKQKEAKWAANLFMVLYLGMLSMIFAYRYNQNMKDIPRYSFWTLNGSVVLYIITLLGVCLVTMPFNFHYAPESALNAELDR